MADGRPAMQADVKQTLAAIHADHEHGASLLAQQACALALRVCVAGQDGTLTADAAIDVLRDLCRQLAVTRASMAPLVAAAAQIAATAWGDDAAQSLAAAAAVVRAMQTTWHDAPMQIAAQLRGRLGQHERVVTLSRSGAVEQALVTNADRIASITVLESRPGGEGVAVARHLAAAGKPWQIQLLPDAACMLALRDATCCVVGADALLPAGCAVNKTGTYPLALAAQATHVPCYVVAETLKIAPASWQWQGEIFAPTLLVPAPIPGVTVTAVAFERVPLALVTVLTEHGVYDAAMLAARGHQLDDGFARLQTTI